MSESSSKEDQEAWEIEDKLTLPFKQGKVMGILERVLDEVTHLVVGLQVNNNNRLLFLDVFRNCAKRELLCAGFSAEVIDHFLQSVSVLDNNVGQWTIQADIDEFNKIAQSRRQLLR